MGLGVHCSVGSFRKHHVSYQTIREISSSTGERKKFQCCFFSCPPPPFCLEQNTWSSSGMPRVRHIDPSVPRPGAPHSCLCRFNMLWSNSKDRCRTCIPKKRFSEFRIRTIPYLNDTGGSLPHSVCNGGYFWPFGPNLGTQKLFFTENLVRGGV